MEFQSLVKVERAFAAARQGWETAAAYGPFVILRMDMRPREGVALVAPNGRVPPGFLDGMGCNLATALPHRHDSRAPPVPRADDIVTLNDPTVAAIFAYWDGKRGGRRMPSRTDIDPVDLRSLVNNIALYDVVEPGPRYRVRLVGSDIAEFDGRNTTGEWVGAGKPPLLVAQITGMLTDIVVTRAPRFRGGLVYWNRDKSYRCFESCFLPLSPDDRAVNMILNAVSFVPYL